MARVRAWIRAQPFFAMGDEPVGFPSVRRWRRPVMVTAAVLLVVVLLGPGAPRRPGGPGGPTGGESGSASAPLLNHGTEGEGRSPEKPEETAGADGAGAARGGPPGSKGRPKASPLRLGVVVPTTGAEAQEGAEVRDTVRHRVELANATGGVGGLPVELAVVAAEDQQAVAALPQRVNALVGGFGAGPPAGLPWLLPADPGVLASNVVTAEAAPQAVGQHMGERLRRQGLDGAVGVVVGSGPESAMGAGLASKVRTTTVAAGGGSACTAEVAALRRSGAAALAVAGPPELAARCLQAAARDAWRPRYGSIVAPSAAYAHLEERPEGRGARTVLGLPWPTSAASGAARFRASAASRSYRALVSFAATELAIDVARQEGTVSIGAVAGRSWRSDLFDLAGAAVRNPIPVVATREGWLPLAEPPGSGPVRLPPRPSPPPPPPPLPPLPLPLPLP